MANYTLTNTLTCCATGDITLQIMPVSGQQLPPDSSKITVTGTGAAIRSYDPALGVLVVSKETATVTIPCNNWPASAPVTPVARMEGPYMVIVDNSSLATKADTFTVDFYAGNSKISSKTITSSKL